MNEDMPYTVLKLYTSIIKFDLRVCFTANKCLLLLAPKFSEVITLGIVYVKSCN